MRELSLFSGAGGGLLGTKLLGWEHLGYVEFNDYCQRVIKQRIEDGILDEAPIFGDIRAFISEGYADAYQGMVDVITGGFPCQPFSVAGKGLGEDDPRNMWPQTLDVIRRVRPRFALLENVPGLLGHPYARRIFGDLAESGFNVGWRVLSAAEVGAPHKRDRIWIYGYANSNGEPAGSIHAETSIMQKDVADAECERQQRQGWPINGVREEKNREGKADFTITNTGWSVEPDVGRVANGVAHRMDRLKAIGNGQVSAVVRAAWEILSE